ncbi:MAG: radical SAM protein [Anaerolineae bacterium]|nr:radical SAM protein [Anaerolineae bacterium]
MKPKHLLNLVSDRLHTLPLAVMYLTDGCNSRCVTCDIWRSPRRNMPMALVEQIAGSFAGLQTRWVLLSGGEAMQHPQWPEIARRFRDEGAFVMLLTNGLLLKKQADEAAASVDEVIVSLDGGTAETYHAIRGVDAFDLVLDGIRAVRTLGVPVATRTTLQRANYREMPQIIDAAKAAGVNRVSFLTVDVSNAFAFGPRNLPQMTGEVIPLLATMGPGAPPDHGPLATALTPEDVDAFERLLETVERDYAADFEMGLIAEEPAKLRRMVDYFRALHGQATFPTVRCNSPHISTVIGVDGTLQPCYFLPSYGKLTPDGTLPLGDAINLPEALALRRAYRAGERPECGRCVCPLYKGPRALMRM